MARLPDPPLSEEIYQVFQICFAKVERRVHDNFIFRDMHDGVMPLNFNLWLLRNAHRVVLVDTGFSERQSVERGRKLDIDPLKALSILGIDPESITDVVLTHLHFDHAGNIGRLPKAHFHVQDAEVAFATGRCMCEHYLRWPFDVEDVVSLVRSTYAGRVTFHDGFGEPYPGVSLHRFSGHTKGIQSVLVNTARGRILLASDVVHYYANLVRRSPFTLTVDLAESLTSFTDLLDLVDGDVQRIVPGHDPKVMRLYPIATYGGVEISALHEEPVPHSIDDLKRLDDF